MSGTLVRPNRTVALFIAIKLGSVIDFDLLIGVS
jgi:hypothetical protein